MSSGNKRYSLLEILGEMFACSPDLKSKAIFFLFVSLLVRLAPVLIAGLVSIFINGFLEKNNDFSLLERLLLLIPVGLLTLFSSIKIAEFIIQGWSRWYNINLMTRVGKEFSQKAFRELSFLPIKEIAKKDSMEWANLLNKRSEIMMGFSLLFYHLLPVVIELLVISIFLFSVGVYKIFFVFALTVLFIVFLRFKINPFLVKYLINFFKTQSSVILRSYETVSKIVLSKLYHSEDFLLNLRTAEEEKEVELYRKYKIVLALTDIIQDAIFAIALIVIFIMSYNLVLSGEISVGIFMALFTLVSAGFFQFKSLIYAFEGIFGLVSVAQPHMDIFSYIKENNIDTSIRPAIRNGLEWNRLLEVKGLSFAYASHPENVILNNCSFSIYRGEKVFFVGRSGSGKTTLLKILLGFEDMSQGDVLLDGVPLVGKQVFSFVPQSLELFNSSVKNNLLLGNPLATDDDLWNSLKKTNMLDKVSALGGLDVDLNSFSGGEKQRLAIARAILSGKPAIILDEPTSSLDMENEQKIISELMGDLDLTLIMTIHRIHSIPLNARVVVIENGRVLQDGKLEVLLEEDGLLSSLWNIGDSD